MAGRREKRWLKSVADPDLVEFFEDSQFDAGEYAKGFYEQREASQAPQRVEKLEGLKRQTEEALRAEVVRNYKAFMLATEEIRSMETGIQTLKDLLGSTAATLQTFRSVHLLEPKPTEKGPAGRSTSRASGGAGRGGDASAGSGADEDSTMGLEGDVTGPSRGLKLPEWLDQAPIELEELLLERKHQAAAALIGRVREFAGNVQNATNLGRGVERIFQRVETMAAGMADRLLAEIAAANTLTVWGFREHKSNFALLITLGHGEKAAVSFVGERSAMIRRSLRLVEVTADPLSYVGTLSETFFGQVSDAITAFLRLFCGRSKIHQRRSNKSGKSVAYYQVYQGVKACGTAPFCRLVVWMNQQIDQYALLVGRQIRGVTMGPQRVTRVQTSRKLSVGGGTNAGGGGGAGPGAGSSSTGSWASSAEEAGFRLGPVASSLFSIVSLILEEAFAAAARLNTYGFPVGVQLASRLVPDVTHFLSAYVNNVRDNMVEAIKKDAFVAGDCKMLPPEALIFGTMEDEERKAQTARLTSSARIMVLEARDILDYALVLLEPPPPEDESSMVQGGPGASSSSISSTSPPSSPPGDVPGSQTASYYTRDEFLELQPVIVKSLERLLRTYLKETTTCVRARREDLSSNQASAAASNLSEIGGIYVPLLASWCSELLPEIADEEEVTSLRALETEFQRSAANPIRPKDISASASRTSTSSRSSVKSPWSSSTSPSGSTGTMSVQLTAAGAAAAASKGVVMAGRSSTGSSNRASVGSSVGRLSIVSSTSTATNSATMGPTTEQSLLRDDRGEFEPPSERRRVSRASDASRLSSSSSRSDGRPAASSTASAAAEAAAAAAAAAATVRSSIPPISSRPPPASVAPSSAPVPARKATPSVNERLALSSRGGSKAEASEAAAAASSLRRAIPSTSARPAASAAGTSHTRKGSWSAGGGGLHGTRGSSTSLSTTAPSPPAPATGTPQRVPSVASRYLAAAQGASASGSGGGSGYGASPPLPASMRRPTMTLKAARAAAEAKAKAAAEAREKASGGRDGNR